MVSEFIFFYVWLNLAFFIFEKRKIVFRTGLLEEKTVENFEYRKNNNSYWDKIKLYQQVINKALLIAEVFYPEYSFFFFLIIQ